jgi:hypothetical protein
MLPSSIYIKYQIVLFDYEYEYCEHECEGKMGAGGGGGDGRRGAATNATAQFQDSSFKIQG